MAKTAKKGLRLISPEEAPQNQKNAGRVKRSRPDWREHARALEESLRHDKARPGHSLDDVSDLPPALLRELKTRPAELLESQICAVLQARGGSANLDEILIGLYRKFQLVQKRRFLQNKLWRMVRKGQLKTGMLRGVFGLSDSPPRKARRRQKA
ncbi:MAG: hypothetical protein JO261_14720 [Alphaproteobacteria bacterium]|nr:hypothetical protein [Alphaproteobacteria bacterium]MBV9694948.1 hypothetical protein [Alphaproteobacteria bacterium]